MDSELYNFKLPMELIAQKPANPRDHARLLVYDTKSQIITDDYFYNLKNYLNKNTTLVINNSKVDNCRWLFDSGKTEIFVLEKSDLFIVRAKVRPGRKFRVGTTNQINSWLTVKVVDSDREGIHTLKLSVPHNDPRLKAVEHIPLPPYIAQNDKLADDYQTIYAKTGGSLAAPTAGLHFTPKLLRSIRDNFSVAELTLHVGLGTFAKLTSYNLSTNKLHAERYEIDQAAADIINKSTHITAVGTTSARTLETIGRSNKIEPSISSTDIFIRPGYKFKLVDNLVTNFHLPSTSLLMLVAALIADKQNINEQQAAVELIRIYNYAVKECYRFYSFGDAMLIK